MSRFMAESATHSRTERMRQIRDEVVDFKQSPLYFERIKNKVYPVIGEGSHEAKVMFIGEAPGRNEAATGHPFCGAAGRVLDELLASIRIDRKDVYVTNIVKDRPPNNRDPLPEEIALYAPFLDRQIEIIRPKVLALLGRHSMKYIMEKFGLTSALLGISKIHGQVFDAEAAYGPIKIVALYHPAAALYSPALKDVMLKDIETLKSLL